jgi:hypothetical protein
VVYNANIAKSLSSMDKRCCEWHSMVDTV